MLSRVWAHFKADKEQYASLQALATIIAIIVGGIWTYTLTAQFRETQPKLTIKQEVSARKLRNGATLLRVDSVLTNSSKVRIEKIEGKMIVIRLLPETAAQLAEYSKGKFWFICEEKGVPLPGCIQEQGLNVPPSSRKEFSLSDSTAMEPGEDNPFWRYLYLDGDVSAVEIYTAIKRPNRSDNEWVFDNSFNVVRH